jgi:hypothetical protein
MACIQTIRTLCYRLVFTSENHIDFSWLLTLLIAGCGVFGFLSEVLTGHHASVAAWSFLGACFAAVLVAAVPIAKARLLAQSTMVSAVAEGIAHSAPEPFKPHEWANGDPHEGDA